jgi:hypothetical protein
MANGTNLRLIKECLTNKWQTLSTEELAEQILQEDVQNPELKKRTVEMISAWKMNHSNVRGKYQIMKEADSQKLLENFIQDYLRAG